jgi:hypothetical protein
VGLAVGCLDSEFIVGVNSIRWEVCSTALRVVGYEVLCGLCSDECNVERSDVNSLLVSWFGSEAGSIVSSRFGSGFGGGVCGCVEQGGGQ